MATFKDREKGFEDKFAHDKEFEFKVMARRNRLLGEWAAGHLGLEGEAVRAYALEVVEADFQEVGDEDVFAKVWGDFQAKEVAVSEHQLRRRMEEDLEEARSQLKSE